MAIRFTETEKWRDPAFRRMAPEEKLLYWYMWDNCDAAGFWEVDLEAAAFATGLQRERVEAAYSALSSRYVASGGTIWLRTFLRHQKNLPLRLRNLAHRSIVRLIECRLDAFPDLQSLLPSQIEDLNNPLPAGRAFDPPSKGDLRPTGKSVGIGIGIGKEGGVGGEADSDWEALSELKEHGGIRRDDFLRLKHDHPDAPWAALVRDLVLAHHNTVGGVKSAWGWLLSALRRGEAATKRPEWAVGRSTLP